MLWQCFRPSTSTNAKVGRRPQVVIPTGAYPDFLLRGTHQQPRVRISRTTFANATNLHKESGVAQGWDLLFHFRESECAVGRSPPGSVSPSTAAVTSYFARSLKPWAIIGME